MRPSPSEHRLFPLHQSTGWNVTWIAGVAVVYFLAAWLGLALVIKPEGIAPVWLPGGIFLSAILLTRRDLRPRLAAVVGVTDFVAELLAGTPPLTGALYAASLTADALFSAWLLTRFVGAPLDFGRTRDVVGLLAFAVVVSNSAASTVAAAAATLIPGSPYWVSWRLWAASDGIGTLLVTPLILSWFSPRRLADAWTRRRVLEAAALFVPLAAVNAAAFGWLWTSGVFSLVLPYSIIPFLLWAALRFETRGVTAALIVLAGIIIPSAAAHRLPTFHWFGAPLSDVIVVQLYLAVMAIPSLFLAANVSERKRAVETRVEQEALLNKAEEIAGVGSWQLDLTTNQLVWSEEVYRIFGVPAGTGQSYETFMECVHPDDRAAVAAAYFGSLRDGKDSYEVEHRVVRPSTGEIRHVHEKCEHICDASGRIARSLGMVRDVTEAKQAEQTVRESEARFRSLFEDLPVAVWQEDFSGIRARIQELRRAGVEDLRAHLDAHPGVLEDLVSRIRVVEVNQTAVQAFGGTSKEQTAGNVTRYSTAESLDAFKDIVVSLDGGRRRVRCEIPLRTLDGRERVFDVTLSVQTGHEADLSRVLLSLVDVTERKRSEEAFRALSRKDEEALRAAQMGHWEFDVGTGLFTFNDQYYRLHGTTAEEAGGYQMSAEAFARTYVHPDDAHRVRDAIQQAVAATDPAFQLETESRILTSHGVRTVAVWFRIQKDARGATVRLHGINQDITERRAAEAALRQQDRYIQAILEHAPIGFALNTIDDGKGVFVGGRFEDIYCVPRGSIHTVEEYFDKVYPDPEFRELIRARMMADMATGDASRMRWEDLPITAADGERRFVTAINIPLLDQNLMVSTVQDVTARHKAEVALRESEERFRTVIEQAGDGFELLDAEGRFVDVNETTCLQMGYSREQLLGMTVFDVDPQFSPERYRATFDSLIGQPPLTFQSTHRRSDGTTFPVEITTSVILLSEGLRSVTIVRDVTERKRAEQEREKLQAQLMQAQKMESVGRLAGGVAHDFNNMLGVILGNVELALVEPTPGPILQESLQQIGDAAMRSADLTRQLLAFARKQTIAPKVLDLNGAVAGMLKMLKRLIGEDIDLAWIPGADVWPVKMDPAQLDQILANLCVNARDAIKGVGKVTIETTKEAFDDAYCLDHPGSIPGQFVLLAVTDDGSGMSRDVLDHLFEPFFTTKDMGRGTGLGLSTVYGIVKQNDGFVNVYSEPGSGSTFRIYLPRFDAAAVDVLDDREAAAPTGGSETVLIVEDERMILRLGMRILGSLGYAVMGAQTPREALAIAARHPGTIHLLITDVVMPEMHGRDLRDRLLATRPETRTLFVSGYTANSIAHHGVLEDGIQFLQKPFTIRSLAAKVRETLEREQ